MAVKRRTIGRHGGVNIVEFCWNAAPRRDLLGKPSRVPLCHSAAIDQRSAWNNIGLCEGLFSVGFTVLLGGVKRVYWHCAEVLLYLLTMRCGVSQATQLRDQCPRTSARNLKKRTCGLDFFLFRMNGILKSEREKTRLHTGSDGDEITIIFQ